MRQVFVALALVSCSSLALASVDCERSEGTPPDDTRLTISIDSPEPGAVLAPMTPCKSRLTVSGRYSVSGPPASYDFYVVIDQSGSTNRDSGADVNGNGIYGEPKDTIYQAEIEAAQQFVRAIDPSASRAAVVSFSAAATLEHQLSADLASVDATLEIMRSDALGPATRYVQAMQGVIDEVNLRGDPATRRQRCIFLSDGEQSESLAEVDAKSRELAALGVTCDTFALGFLTSPGLETIAANTGGRFTALATPGDIIALLPSFAANPPASFTGVNATSGENAAMTSDEAAGTFSADVTLTPGVNTITLTLVAESVPRVTLECTIEVTALPGMLADAGPDLSACAGQRILLDGSRSVVSTCADAQYSWMDCMGNEACPPSSDPTCLAVPTPGCGTYMLAVTCPSDGGCVSKDPLEATIVDPPPVRPFASGACPNRDVALTCGTPSPSSAYAWDLDTLVDADGDGDAANDRDMDGCDVLATWPVDGVHQVRALEILASGCTFPVADGTITIAGGAVPGESDGVRVAHQGAQLDVQWFTTAGAQTYRVLRGTIDTLWATDSWDHAADSGAGSCDTLGAIAFSDLDDAATDGGKWYYLVTAVSDCGGEGPTGFGFDGLAPFPRLPRAASASCP